MSRWRSSTQLPLAFTVRTERQRRNSRGVGATESALWPTPGPRTERAAHEKHPSDGRRSKKSLCYSDCDCRVRDAGAASSMPKSHSRDGGELADLKQVRSHDLLLNRLHRGR